MKVNFQLDFLFYFHFLTRKIVNEKNESTSQE